MDSGMAVLPAVLRPGDVVRLVSPSGPVRAEQLTAGVKILTSWGLRVELAPHGHDRHGYLAGTDADRLADLNAALADPRVRGVICTRGGYGAQRIVDGIDMAAVRTDPKLVVGFSDITALQLALWRGARLSTVHGPGVRRLPELDSDSAMSMRLATMSSERVVVRPDPGEPTAAVVVAGTSHGILLGGNLCLLASSVGTRDQPDLDGAILLIEDVDEPPYKVDRMLTQLRRAGLLDGLVGVAIGQFTNCTDGWPTSVADVLGESLGDLGVPVLGGLPIGHGEGRHVSIPFGTPSTLDTVAGTLTVASALRA